MRTHAATNVWAELELHTRAQNVGSEPWVLITQIGLDPLSGPQAYGWRKSLVIDF